MSAFTIAKRIGTVATSASIGDRRAPTEVTERFSIRSSWEDARVAHQPVVAARMGRVRGLRGQFPGHAHGIIVELAQQDVQEQPPMLLVPCPVCGHMNPVTALRCEDCGHSFVQVKPDRK